MRIWIGEKYNAPNKSVVLQLLKIENINIYKGLYGSYAANAKCIDDEYFIFFKSAYYK